MQVGEAHAVAAPGVPPALDPLRAAGEAMVNRLLSWNFAVAKPLVAQTPSPFRMRQAELPKVEQS